MKKRTIKLFLPFCQKYIDVQEMERKPKNATIIKTWEVKGVGGGDTHDYYDLFVNDNKFYIRTSVFTGFYQWDGFRYFKIVDKELCNLESFNKL